MDLKDESTQNEREKRLHGKIAAADLLTSSITNFLGYDR
jgi:hypothetical protein